MLLFVFIRTSLTKSHTKICTEFKMQFEQCIQSCARPNKSKIALDWFSILMHIISMDGSKKSENIFQFIKSILLHYQPELANLQLDIDQIAFLFRQKLDSFIVT